MKFLSRRVPAFLLTILLTVLSVYSVMQAAVDLPDPNSYGGVVYSTVYCVYPNLLGAENLQEYKLALRLLKKDKDFIAYDALRQIGEFADFAYTSNWSDGEFGRYTYAFDNKSSFLAVYAKPCEAGNQKSYQKIRIENLEDMRFCDEIEPSQIILDGVCYQYADGTLDKIAWENETHEFILSVDDTLNYLEPGDGTFIGDLFNERTAKTAVEQFNRSVQFNVVLRKTQVIRLIAQWSVAAICLIWGIFQLLNLPVELRKKTVHALVDETVRKKYRRECGVVKILLAAVFACMAFVEMFEPVYMLAFLAVYALLLLLVLAQQWLITREYLRMNSDREEYSAVMEARRKFKWLGIATARRLPILILAVTLLLSVHQVNLAAVPLPDKSDYTYGIYSRQVLSAYDLQEYKTAIRQIRQDGTFISYESLRRLGVLRGFTYESDWTKGEYGLYTYSFVDDANPVWRSCTLRICLKAYAEAKKNTADKMLKEYLEDMAFDAERDAFGNKTERLAWETDTHYFLLEYNPEGKSGDDAAVKAELEKLSRSIKVGLAVRKTGSIRLTVQWAVAAVCLVWGILQLLNIPAELRKKTVAQLENDLLRKKYRRDCGIIKLSLAALFACMAFVELFEPVFMLAFAAVYVFLLLLVLTQQMILTREYVELPKPMER